jgi:flagella basal body P-ring formation protein FlgA
MRAPLSLGLWRPRSPKRRRRLAIVAVLLVALPAAGQETRAPSAKAIIYPGDVITEEMLVDAPLSAQPFGGPVALSSSDIVGMAAIRTLLPGASIPMSAVAPPRAFRAGTEVKMIYIDGGLTITATGSALQDGVVGQTVKLRNNDSGVTVSGRVRADGAVVMSGG